MKNLFLGLFLFIAGVVVAKYFTATQTVPESSYEETYEGIDSKDDSKELQIDNSDITGRDVQSVSTEVTEPAISKIDLREKKAIQKNIKIHSIDEKLKALDRKLSSDLKELKRLDSEFANDLEKEINDKSQLKIDGEDEFTDKEYQ